MPFEQRHSEENGTAGSKDTDVSWHMGTITDLRQAWISNNSYANKGRMVSDQRFRGQGFAAGLVKIRNNKPIFRL